MDVLQVPLHEPRQNADGVFVWECSGSALDEGDAPSKWFSDYLGKPNHLVRFNAVLLLKKSEMLSHGQGSEAGWIVRSHFNRKDLLGRGYYIGFG
ncbi:uncharacterized protein LOC120072503 isoform X4 [Benincasa hispida]|uniref:uncharacterized protein LOC120072503 isoform X4 n=1 Tax=Benincasa hispida TaxID=102211 RepID=UPI0019026712|nr:uncharacterized protein LOC120072503 isoform X4 [Benincasa hispida]